MRDVRVEVDYTDTKEFTSYVGVSGELVRGLAGLKDDVLTELRGDMAGQMREEGYAVPRNWPTVPIEHFYDAMFDIHHYHLRIVSYRYREVTYDE